MKEDLLARIKEEATKEISTMDEYNNYAKRRNELAEYEEIKKSLGLPYNRDMYLPEKTETKIILETYKKYLSHIEEKDTNGIYIYIGTFMPSGMSEEEFEEGFPLDTQVDINDPRATHRIYWNLEGIWSKSINIEDCEEFEKTHTVLYVDNFYNVESEFITTAVKEGQEQAVTKILKKYNKCKNK